MQGPDARAAFVDPQRALAEDLAHSAKAEKPIGSKINYTRGPLRKIRVVADFLPRPEEPGVRVEGVKFTLSLSR